MCKYRIKYWIIQPFYLTKMNSKNKVNKLLLLKIYLIFLANIFNSYLNSQNFEKFKVGLGPEDMVLDSINEFIIIACGNKRTKNTIDGSFFRYDVKSNSIREFKLINQPKNFTLNPLGISLFTKKSDQYLFVVNHFNKGKNSNILRYKIKSDKLIFERAFVTDNLSCNNIMAIDTATFYFTNDKPLGGKVYLHKNNQLKKVAKGLSYPNGLWKIDSTLYVSLTTGSKVLAYKINEDGSLSNKKKITKIKGADNFSNYKEHLIVTSHPRFLKFIKHFKNPERKSPSLVYVINPKAGKKKVIFEDKIGNLISAASTAIFYKNHLYISQVFDDFIIKVPLNEKELDF